MGARQPQRRLDVLSEPFRPAYVVWELTLACDHACSHCGSRAGPARGDELSTKQALTVAEELATMGTEEVVLIGGEAYLHPGFLDVIQALSKRGIRATLTTGGFGVDHELARAMKAAGLLRMSVSIDGLEPTHDRMRSKRGSFRAGLAALEAARKAGIKIAANTNLNRLNQADLEPLYETLRDAGIRSWQLQLTAPLGRAADRPQMLLMPYDLLDLVPRIAAVKERAFAEGIVVMPGNNLGYFGPEEGLLRSPRQGGSDHWAGCQAGRFVMGIESDGAVKGCPSLQTSHYVGGRLRRATSDEHIPTGELLRIWNETPELAFARTDRSDELWGFCATCPFSDPCRGGCSFTAHAFFGRRGNNPYCHYRARAMHKRGLRERLVPGAAAPGRPFDHGRFEIVVEPSDAPEPPLAPPDQLVRITRRPARQPEPEPA